MLYRWIMRMFNGREGAAEQVSCPLQFNRRSRRRLLWSAILTRGH